jgi:hypothetical protein
LEYFGEKKSLPTKPVEIDKEKIASTTVLAQHHSEASILRSYDTNLVPAQVEIQILI